MSAWATINGIDVVLAAVGAVGWTLWRLERSASHLEPAPRQEAFESNLPEGVKCGSSSHHRFALGFSGRGEKVRTLIPRPNPPVHQQTCLLNIGHPGPHMGPEDVWEDG